MRDAVRWPVEAATVSPEGTRALAAALAPLCRAGDVVLLVGDLGTGKTVFAQGFAGALGVAGPVTSPTFALVRHYRCHPPSPVDVRMDEVGHRARRLAAVVAHQCEGRAGHRARHAQRRRKALREHRLAGTEVAHEQDDVAGPAQRCEPPGQRPGRVGGGRRRLDRPLHVGQGRQIRRPATLHLISPFDFVICPQRPR